MSSSAAPVRRRLLAAGALTATAALALTACGHGTSDHKTAPTASGAATTASSATTAPAAPTRKPTATPTTPAASVAPAAAVCTSAVVRIKVLPVSNPIDHVAVRATNTGKQPCTLYGHPTPVLGARHGAIKAVAESRHGAGVTLAPGAAAYAGILTSAADGSGSSGGTKIKTISLGFQSPSGAPAGPLATADVPGGTLYVEPAAAAVTYWQPTLASAIQW